MRLQEHWSTTITIALHVHVYACVLFVSKHTNGVKQIHIFSFPAALLRYNNLVLWFSSMLTLWPLCEAIQRQLGALTVGRSVPEAANVCRPKLKKNQSQSEPECFGRYPKLPEKLYIWLRYDIDHIISLSFSCCFQDWRQEVIHSNGCLRFPFDGLLRLSPNSLANNFCVSLIAALLFCLAVRLLSPVSLFSIGVSYLWLFLSYLHEKHSCFARTGQEIVCNSQVTVFHDFESKAFQAWWDEHRWTRMQAK